MTVPIPVREPFDGGALLAFLAARAIPGLESATATTFTRGTITLDFGPRPDIVPHSGTNSGLGVRVEGADPREAVRVARRVADADADPQAIADVLGDDPLLGPLLRERPGLRAPGAFDAYEIAVRAIVGQAISVPAARTILTRLAERGLLTDQDALSATDPATLPMPRRRARALVDLAAGRSLADIPGVGPWTLGYVALRTGDPDVLLHGDLVVARTAARLGGPATPRDLARHGERWSPFRSYATHLLWAAA